MSVREDPARPGCWVVDCRPEGYKGKRVRVSIEGSRELALAWERKTMRRPIEAVTVSARMLAGIYPAWMTYYRVNRAASTVKDVESCWRNFLGPFFGRMQPKVITRALIEKYKAARIATGVTPRTVTKELSYLAGFLRWAADMDFCDPLPFAISGFSRKMTAPPKPRPLTPAQISAILAAIAPQYRLIFLLMADAGLRLAEAIGLQRSHVEFEHGVIFVIGKGSKERIVPITTDRLQAELDARRGVNGYLSVNPKTGQPYYNIRKALLKAVTAAGVEKAVNHHLLRHSFGTNATAAHLDLSSLQAIMGHSSPVTTNMYQHLAGEYLREQGRRLNVKVLQEDEPEVEKGKEG